MDVWAIHLLGHHDTPTAIHVATRPRTIDTRAIITATLKALDQVNSTSCGVSNSGSVLDVDLAPGSALDVDLAGTSAPHLGHVLFLGPNRSPHRAHQLGFIRTRLLLGDVQSPHLSAHCREDVSH